MGIRLLFYGILYPLSLLPVSVLYIFFGKPIYWLLFYVVKYREDVILKNLKNSFPEKKEQELLFIKKNYYRHLANLIVEMVKMLTISKKELIKRYSCLHSEPVNAYFQQGKSVILMSSHYNNWEWMVLSLNSQFLHHGVGVGAPNSNKVFEYLVNKARTRYGTEVVFANTIRQEFERRDREHIYTAYMMLSDQSPANPDKSYKMLFMHQPTAVIFGAEYYAKKYQLPVFYYDVEKSKRGYYRINIQLITANPENCEHGEITEKYIRLLSNTIDKFPEYWLWSHKRWKHKIE